MRSRTNCSCLYFREAFAPVACPSFAPSLCTAMCFLGASERHMKIIVVVGAMHELPRHDLRVVAKRRLGRLHNWGVQASVLETRLALIERNLTELGVLDEMERAAHEQLFIATNMYGDLIRSRVSGFDHHGTVRHDSLGLRGISILEPTIAAS